MATTSIAWKGRDAGPHRWLGILFPLFVGYEKPAVFTNMAPERLCLGCGLRVEETFTPIYPGERGPLFAASVKLLQCFCCLFCWVGCWFLSLGKFVFNHRLTPVVDRPSLALVRQCRKKKKNKKKKLL